jgi:hypothetical protein
MADIYNNVRGKWQKITSDSVVKMIRSEPTAEVTRTGVDSLEIYIPTAHPDVRLTRVKNLSKYSIKKIYSLEYKNLVEMDVM